MGLSKRDRRLLEQLESALHRDDPGLDALMKPADGPTWTARRLHVAGVVVLVGLVVMACGVGLGDVWVGVLGFLAVSAGAAWIASSQDRADR